MKIRKAIPYREILDALDERRERNRSQLRQVRVNKKELQTLGLYEQKIRDVGTERVLLDQILWRIQRLRYC